MPQLIMGPSNPIAVSIEVGSLCYMAASPPFGFLENMSPLWRAVSLGGLYFAYNTMVVPSFSDEN